jgi:hypothetical protein
MPTIEEIDEELARRQASQPSPTPELSALDAELAKRGIPVDPDTAAPMMSNAPPSLRQTQGRTESSPLARIGGAISDPFKETQFGIPASASDKFQAKSGPMKVFNTFNSLLIDGVASPAFTVLQALGAGADGAIDGMAQTLIEAGGDVQKTQRGARDIKGLLEVLPATLPINALSSAPKARLPRKRLEAIPDDIPLGEQLHSVAASKQLSRPVSLTKGDITRNPGVQAFEDEAMKGIHGNRAEGLMKTARADQDAAIRGNFEDLQTRMTGRALPATQENTGLGAERAANALKKQAETDKANIGIAYDEARALDASVDGALLKSFSNRMKGDLAESGFDLEEMQFVNKRLDEFSTFTKDGRFTRATVTEIELLRKRINKNINSKIANDPSEGAALIQVKRRLDDFVGEMIEQDLIYGNTEAIDAWKNARFMRYEYSNKFKSNKIIQSITEDDLTQEQVLNKLFGTSQMGFKTDSGAAVKKIKEVLGADSEAFTALKEEAVLRLIKNQMETGRGVSFSGVKFNTALTKAMNDSPTTMRSLFTSKELADMRSLGNVSYNITFRVPGSVNHSGTAISGMRLAKTAKSKILKPAVQKVPIVGDFIETAMDIHSGIEDANMIRGNLLYEQTVLTMGKDPYTLSRTLKTHSIPTSAAGIGVAMPQQEQQ